MIGTQLSCQSWRDTVKFQDKTIVNCSYADEKTGGAASTKEDNGGSEVVDVENNAMSTQTEAEEVHDNEVEMKMMNNSTSAEGAAICCMAANEDYEASSRNLDTNFSICRNTKRQIES